MTSAPNNCCAAAGLAGAFLLAAWPLIGAGAADSLAPLPAQPAPVASHAPYESGECGLCHQSADPKRPGPVKAKGPTLCLACHEEFSAVLARPHVHAPAGQDCTTCHNPHNARQRKLLRDEISGLCGSCHGDVRQTAAGAKVKHGALAVGRSCANCHNPHGSSVQRLLVAQPFDLCLGCHDNDRLKSADGKPLGNMKAWLAANPEWHDPVRARDCSACHQPHGAANFRLLKEYYPPEFYAPYGAQRYALCFSCHQERAFVSRETTTLTGFRDGAKNLHFVHLHQGDRGRTCRACHEVHASKQKLHVRDGVPYGSSGWVLKLNYARTPSGGSCEKTCHQKRSYSRTSP